MENNKKKFDLKFIITVGVAGIAIILAIIALCVGGPVGPKGRPGDTGAKGDPGAAGANGKSAYELAVEKGYNGTLAEWLGSLVGEKGDEGAEGKSAYQLYLDTVPEGTTPLSVEEWLGSLIGSPGSSGNDGKSAYELYLDTVPEGTTPLSLVEWLDSLVGSSGASGSDGKSAYELYLDTVPEGTTPLTLEQWLASLKGEGSSSGITALADIEEYDALVELLDRYSFDVITDYNAYCLENSEDVLGIYDNVESCSMTFRSTSKMGPFESSTWVDYYDDTDPVEMPALNEMCADAFCVFDINRVGDPGEQYVALHLYNYRLVTIDTYADFFEATRYDGGLEREIYTIFDVAEFTKINDKYYMIFKCDSFGCYYIQEFSEEVYKYVVASIIYGMYNVIYDYGTTRYESIDGFDYYLQTFTGSKTDTSASFNCRDAFSSSVEFDDEDILSYSLTIRDYIIQTSEVPVYIDSHYCLNKGDSHHVYMDEIPTEGIWAEATSYCYNIGIDNAVDVLNDLDDHFSIYAEIIYEIIGMAQVTFDGAGLGI